jgi:predicted alpha/beta-fold hydrolase
MFDYRDVQDYYLHASCAASLDMVATPLLCVNALDDPIAPSEGVSGRPHKPTRMV